MHLYDDKDLFIVSSSQKQQLICVISFQADNDKDPVSTGNTNGSKKRNRKSSKEEEKVKNLQSFQSNLANVNFL